MEVIEETPLGVISDLWRALFMRHDRDIRAALPDRGPNVCVLSLPPGQERAKLPLSMIQGECERESGRERARERERERQREGERETGRMKERGGLRVLADGWMDGRSGERGRRGEGERGRGGERDASVRSTHSLIAQSKGGRKEVWCKHGE